MSFYGSKIKEGHKITFSNFSCKYEKWVKTAVCISVGGVLFLHSAKGKRTIAISNVCC
jgi:hypothetical protein